MYEPTPGRPQPLLRRMFYWLDEYSPIVLLNVLWFLLSILILPLLPATAALYYAMNELAHERGASFTKFFEGFKRYFWTSFKWGIPSLLVAAMLFYNIYFYGALDAPLSRLAQVLSVLMAVIFGAMQLYIFPLLIEQEKPALLTAVRNSLMVLLRFPLHTFGLLLIVVALVFFSTFVWIPLWVLFSMALIAYLSNRVLISLVGQIPRKEQQEKESTK